MRSSGAVWAIAWTLAAAAAPAAAQTQPAEPAGRLVREVVYNELHDHQSHGFWRYWIEQYGANETRLQEEVETSEGPIARLVATNGQPVNAQARNEEQERLDRLVNSPQQRASHRRDYADDEKHITLIMGLLPEAFDFEYAGEENGCYHLRFHPSPQYVPRTVEARVIHSVTGELWVNARFKRLARVEGRLDQDVAFGFGLLGRVDKGGWFRMQRTQVSPTEWKTQKLELHMSGRAFMLKTIAKETDEVRGGFVAVPAGINLAQGVRILNETDPQSPPGSVARVAPVSVDGRR